MSDYFGCGLTKTPYTADVVRLEGWWYMLGGGAGTINLNDEYYRGNESGRTITRNQIVPQRKVLKDFMNKLILEGLSRYTNLSGIPDSAFCQVLAEPGNQYVVYLFHGEFESEWGAHFLPVTGNYSDTITINNVPDKEYFVQWVDPASGKNISAENLLSTEGNLLLKTPRYSLDIACIINNHK